MASHFDRRVPLWSEGQLGRLGHHLLLVPEGLLLVPLLALHIATGGAGIVALGVLLLVLIFLLRSWLMLGARSAMGRARYRRAGRLLGLALRLHPRSADAIALRGILRLAQGHTEAAERDLRQAITLFPERGSFHAALGSALLEAGEVVEARWECLRALEIDPRCAEAYLHLAQAEQKLGVPLTEVERHLREGLGAHPDPAGEAALRCALALLLLEQQRNREAELVMVSVESLAARCTPTERAAILYYIAEVERGAGHPDAARDHFRASEQIDPNGRHAAAAWRAARI